MDSQKRGRAASPRRGGSEGSADAAPDNSAPATRAPGAGGESEPSASEGSVQASTGAAAAAREPLGPPATAALPPLPDTLALLIFALLPVRKRLYCRRVSRAWRRALELPALWRSVDLRNTQGWPDATRARVLGLASRMAAGQVQTLRVEFHRNSYPLQDHACLDTALVEAASENAATLVTLEVSYERLDIDLLTQLAERCGALDTFRVDELKCSLQNDADAQRLLAVLSGDGCYKAVAVESLVVEHLEQLTYAAALIASVERHRSLRGLHIFNFDSSAAAMALGLAAARAGAVDFTFAEVGDEEELAQQAALLLNGFPVERLVLRYSSDNIHDRMCAPFATAVRNHRSLSYLGLEYMAIGEETVEVLHALVGHPTLQSLSLYGSATDWRDPGIRLHEALAELLAAPSKLTYLSMSCMHFDDDCGLAVSLAGLASPHARLEYLDLTMNQEITPRFAARVIGPAVLRCATLKELELEDCERDVLHAAHLHINKLLQIKNEKEEEDAA
jgi:hypothetical protein